MTRQNPQIRAGGISFRAYSLEDACRRMLAVGYDGVEFTRPQMREVKTPELLSQFVEYTNRIGLRMCALNDVDAEEFRPFDGESGFERTLQMMKEGIRLGNTMGVKSVMYWEGVRPRGNRSEEELEKTIVDLYKKATEFSAKFGIRLLVEPHPFSLGMNLHYLTNLADSQDEKYFGILFDTCHFGVGKPDEYIEAIRFLGKRRIKYIHFSDSDMRTSELHYPPGRGRLDLEGIVGAFREIDYDGEISLDTWGYPLPEEAAKAGIPYLKQVLRKLGLD